MSLREFRHPALWVGLWMAGWGLCIALSLLPPIELQGPRDSDKIGHLLAYFTLSAWAAMLFRTGRARLVAALALVALGIGLEFAQAQLTVTRQGDWRDAVANTLGVVIGQLMAFTPAASMLQHFDRIVTRR